MKPRVIILEGISGSGKSTFHHAVGQLSGYRDSVISRFTPSMWVYNKVYGREEVDYESINQALEQDHEVHVIWLIVDVEEALRRKVAKGDLDKLEDMEAAHLAYEEYFDRVTVLRHVYWIDTTGRTEDDVLIEIARALGE